jgi:hypothetical protein
MKCILRYLWGTLDFRLLLRCSTSSEMMVYTDADKVGCPNRPRSTLSYVVFLGNNLISWYLKCQNIIFRSSAEAEYRVVANGVAEAC